MNPNKPKKQINDSKENLNDKAKEIKFTNFLKRSISRTKSSVNAFRSNKVRNSQLKSTYIKFQEKYDRKSPNYVPNNDFSFFPYKTMEPKDYQDIMDFVTSNSVLKTSLPYSHIIRGILSLFSDKESNEIDKEIERIRKLNIESATDEIIKFSDAIKNANDEKTYWYYYLIVAQAVLRGKLTEKKNSTRLISEKWRMPKKNQSEDQNQIPAQSQFDYQNNGNETDSSNDYNNTNYDYSNNNQHNKVQSPFDRILELGEDPHYDELYERDAEFQAKYLSPLRDYTLYEIKGKMKIPSKSKNSSTKNNTWDLVKNLLKTFASNNTNSDSARANQTQELKRFSKSALNERFGFEKKKELYDEVIVGPPNFREWKGDLHRKRIRLTDFEPNIFLYNHIKNTEFYKLLADFPKGVVHHLHWAAAFYMGDIMRVVDRIIKMKIVSNKVTVLVKTDIYLEDKTRPQSYFDIATPKIFIILDLEKVLKDFKENKYYSIEREFRLHFILADGRCVLNPIGSPKEIDPDIKAFFFLRLCRNSIMYTNLAKDFPKLEFLESTKILDLTDLSIFLAKESHILEDYKNLQKDYLPSSYKNLLFTIKDQVSVAVWFKFEMIFGIYSELFDNISFFKVLSEFLTEDLVNDKVIGVEFRQGYDVHKGPNSKIKVLKNLILDSSDKIKLPSSFILPGRKVKQGHKLKDLIKNLEQAKKNNETDVVGFDFFGYEDDPFTGARNFFTLSITNMIQMIQEAKKNGNAETNGNKESDFLYMLNKMREGFKMYLHAGETLYLPNYPVSGLFFDKFYINDNLIHAALLPNVERVGHGFALINNELLMNIYKKKGISLELCPTSNQALHYYDLEDNPIVKLLRKGLSVTVSSDDPGLFFYSGVRMDWFNLFMSTKLKVSEYYLLVRNSILKSSIKEIQDNKEILLKQAKEDILKFFKSEKLNYLIHIWNKIIEKDKSVLQLLQIYKTEKMIRIEMVNQRNRILEKYLKKNGDRVFNKKNNPYINIYDIKEVLESKKQTCLRKRMKRASGKNFEEKLR